MSGAPRVGRVLVTEEQIATRVGELASEISAAYAGGAVTIVGVLKGALFFLADLARRLELDLTYEVLQVSSYGSGTVPGPARIELTPRAGLGGRDLLLVEDIVDTGRTLALVRDALLREHPRSLRIAALLDKRGRREVDVEVDWTGFTIPNEFVVGYGMDLDERFRHLPYIAVLA